MVTFKIEGNSKSVEDVTRILGRTFFISGMNTIDYIKKDREKNTVTGYVKADKGPLSKDFSSADFFVYIEKTPDAKEGTIIFNSNGNVAPAVKKLKARKFYVNAEEISTKLMKKKNLAIPVAAAVAKAYSQIQIKNIKKAVEIEIGSDKEILQTFDEAYKFTRQAK